jgi:fatty-acid desaturase
MTTYLILLCLLQSLYIFPISHPLVVISILYVYNLFYLSLWKLFVSLFLLIPYQFTSICFYHRYFSHKSFTTSRFMQFIFALIACVTYQGGPIWWASIHRKHHKYCGTIDDPHSPIHGFYYAFLGWPFVETTIYKKYVPDLLKYPELIILDRFSYIPAILTFLFLQYTINTNNTIYLYVYPCILNTLSNLSYNVSYHNPKEKDTCMAIDVNIPIKFCWQLLHKDFSLLLTLIGYILSKLSGEHLHKTHHKHPKQIKRGEYDLAYYFIISPLLKMNLIQKK